MFENLKIYCKSIVKLNDIEVDLIDEFFEVVHLKKNEMLLNEGQICDFIGFISSGTIRHYHIKEGSEKTCDLSFENAWVTDFQSFTSKKYCTINLQALEKTKVFIIRKINLDKMYAECKTFETFGRLMLENVVLRTTNITMSLSSEKPEQRVKNLIDKQPEMFRRVPQKYIASFLGISPESLSRIRSRLLMKLKS